MAESDVDLVGYFQTIKSEVEQLAEREETVFSQEAFADWAANLLVEEAELGESFERAQFERGGRASCRVDGYSIDRDSGRLDLVVSDYEGGATPRSLGKPDTRRLASLAVSFFSRVVNGHSSRLVEPAFESASRMVQDVREAMEELTHVRVVILSDGHAKDRAVESFQVGSYRVDVDVWDLSRLARRFAGGIRSREDIVIDFVELLGGPLACLPAPSSDSRYRAYLTVLSGDTLAQIYARYRARLLEANVRSFLQARGKVNKGIRNTLLEDPGSFFAYNNGLSVTVDEADFVSVGQQQHLKVVRGLQIVNGAQTTASIHRAADRDGADLSAVFIPVKVTLVDGMHLEEMVPNISRYSNSQNVIKIDDFTANNPFHRALEQLSRSVWIPGESGRWFYERARGQFQVEQSRATTVAQRKAFTAQTPKLRVFTKTDLAKFFMAWEGRPDIVSLGAQKCFVRFMDEYVNRARIPVELSPDWYKDLIGRAIVFKAAQRAAVHEALSSYRANVVAYTVALLAVRSGDALRLRRVWDEQNVSEPLFNLMVSWAQPIHGALVRTAGAKNVTEWCKKPECWTVLQQLELPGEIPKLPEVDSGHLRVSSALKKSGNVGGLKQSRQEVVATARKLSEGVVLPREKVLKRLAESLGIQRLTTGARQELESVLDELARTAFLDGKETQLLNALLAGIRKTARTTTDREALMRQVAVDVLDVQRLGKHARAAVEGALATASKRRIITQAGDEVHLRTPTFDSYDDETLLSCLCSVVEKRNRDYFKEDVIDAAVAALGFSQCRSAMRDRVDGIVLQAVKDGTLRIPQVGKLRRGH